MFPTKMTEGKKLFEAFFAVERHQSKKNNKGIAYRRTRAGLKPFVIDKNRGVLRKGLVDSYLHEKSLHPNFRTIDQRIIVKFTFFFPRSNYYTKAGTISRRLGDLSNLVQGPEDALQEAGIITDDTLIEGLDGSRRVPSNGPQPHLKTEIYEFTG